MSHKLGSIAITEPEHPSFWGLRMLQKPTHWGNKIMGTVEDEVERLVNNAYLVAKMVLELNRDLLESLAKKLLENDVVSAEEFQQLLVEFKAHTIDYALFGDDPHRAEMPFQRFPETV